MLFNSLYFIFVFFPIVTFGYFMLPWKWRWFWLLAASCLFYMFFVPKYILILAVTILIDYVAGRVMESCRPERRRMFLVMSIVSNLGMLFFFKYFNFFSENLHQAAEALGWNMPIPYLSIILPIGLSFHTFQSLSYVIEVYRGRQKAERHLGIFALYVMFYPQLVAGPIERPQNLLPQFHERHDFDYAKFVSGLQLVMWGLFKKTVVADRAAVFVNQIYGNLSAYHGSHYLLATVLFAFQIYGDFSGYSDIARGLARTMGFELMRNFRAPYLAASISEFWQRWHISLSSWFRDYVYISLGGNRVSQSRNYFNLFVTFLLSGLWHGANWTYVIWGSLNGLYLIAQKYLGERFRVRVAHVWAVAVNFVLVCLTWVFFRAASLSDAMRVLSSIAREGLDWAALRPYVLSNSMHLTLVAVFIGLLCFCDWLAFGGGAVRFKPMRPLIWRPALTVLALTAVLIFGRFANTQFIYFQF